MWHRQGTLEQSVQNAAAHFVTGIGWQEHVKPVLRQLDWLPSSVKFKWVTLVCRSLLGTAPAYVSDGWHLTSDVAVRYLRSTDSWTCVPRYACNSYRCRCFATASPRLYHSLPQQLRQPVITFDHLKYNLWCLYLGDRDQSALWLVAKSTVYKYTLLLYLLNQSINHLWICILHLRFIESVTMMMPRHRYRQTHFKKMFL